MTPAHAKEVLLIRGVLEQLFSLVPPAERVVTDSMGPQMLSLVESCASAGLDANAFYDRLQSAFKVWVNMAKQTPACAAELAILRLKHPALFDGL